MAEEAEVAVEPERRRVKWRNVAILVAFGSPIWLVAITMSPPLGGPRVASLEARQIVRDYLDLVVRNISSLGNAPNKGLLK